MAAEMKFLLILLLHSMYIVIAYIADFVPLIGLYPAIVCHTNYPYKC